MKTPVRIKPKTTSTKKNRHKILQRLWQQPQRLPRSTVFIALLFATIGSYMLVSSFAATTKPPSVEPEESTQTTTGASTVLDDNASGKFAVRFGKQTHQPTDRFFADDASWNKTITQLGGEFTELKPFAGRLWDYGGGTANGAPPGSFYLDLKDYSVPIYDINTATTTARVFQVVWSQNQQAFSFTGVEHGATIPWNPEWRPGTGNDRIMQVVNYSTGKVYGFWAVGENKNACIDRNPFGITFFDGPNAKAGYNEYNTNPEHLCIAAINTYDTLWTGKDGNTHLDRGMGIDKLALVVRADEVAKGNATSGTIGHALPLTTSNPMFGAGSETPGITQPVYNTAPDWNGNLVRTLVTKGDDPSGIGMIPAPKFVTPSNYASVASTAGITKGFYLKPATRLEHEFGWTGGTLYQGGVTPTPATDAERAKTNPSGMRFGLNVTDGDISTWVSARGYTGEKAKTAATFARTLRDYGAIIAETGGWGIGIETDGVIGPAKNKWQDLGLYNIATDTTSDISFTGLITRDRLYVVKPPN